MQLGKIEDVVVHNLIRHADDRGYFQEIIRGTDYFFGEGFGQLSHSKMYPGVVKAGTFIRHKLIGGIFPLADSEWHYKICMKNHQHE